MIRLSDLCQTLINRSVKVVEYFACNKSEFLIFHSVCLLNSDYKLWDELFFVIELKKKKRGWDFGSNVDVFKLQMLSGQEGLVFELYIFTKIHAFRFNYVVILSL